MTKTEEDIIARIKEQMQMKGFTQTQLGQCLGIRQYQVSRLLDGKPFPSIDQLMLIAANLNCSLLYLLGLKEESYCELSKEAAAVAHAYTNSQEVVQLMVKRILDI